MYTERKVSRLFKFAAFILSRNYFLYCALTGLIINPIIFSVAIWESAVNGGKEAWNTFEDWWYDMPSINREAFSNIQENYKNLE